MSKLQGSIQIYRDLLATLTSENQQFLNGQMVVGYDPETPLINKLYAGDGTNNFVDLIPITGQSILFSSDIPAAGVGSNGDVAILGNTGKIAQKQGGNWAVVASLQDGQVRSINSIKPDENGNISATTDDVPEGSINKYYTDARAIAAPLTGLNTTLTGAPLDTDSIVIAMGKLASGSQLTLDKVLANGNTSRHDIFVGSLSASGGGFSGVAKGVEPTATDTNALTTVGFVNKQIAAITPPDSILNQNSTVQTADFNISGSGTISSNLSVGIPGVQTSGTVMVNALRIRDVFGPNASGGSQSLLTSYDKNSSEIFRIIQNVSYTGSTKNNSSVQIQAFPKYLDAPININMSDQGVAFNSDVQGLTRPVGDSTTSFATTEFVTKAVPAPNAFIRNFSSSGNSVVQKNAAINIDGPAAIGQTLNVGGFINAQQSVSTPVIYLEPSTKMTETGQLLFPDASLRFSNSDNSSGVQLVFTGTAKTDSGLQLYWGTSNNLPAGSTYRQQPVVNFKYPVTNFSVDVTGLTKAAGDISKSFATTEFVNTNNIRNAYVLLTPSGRNLRSQQLNADIWIDGGVRSGWGSFGSIQVQGGGILTGQISLNSIDILPSTDTVDFRTTVKTSPTAVDVTPRSFLTIRGGLSLLAPSIVFNYSPNAPTPTPGDSSSLLATTAFVTNAISKIPAQAAVNAILNQTTLQAGASFNISGNGMIGGTTLTTALVVDGNLTNPTSTTTLTTVMSLRSGGIQKVSMFTSPTWDGFLALWTGADKPFGQTGGITIRAGNNSPTGVGTEVVNISPYGTIIASGDVRGSGMVIDTALTKQTVTNPALSLNVGGATKGMIYQDTGRDKLVFWANADKSQGAAGGHYFVNGKENNTMAVIDSIGNFLVNGGITTGIGQIQKGAANTLSATNLPTGIVAKYQLLNIGLTNQISFFAEGRTASVIGFNLDINATNDGWRAHESGFSNCIFVSKESGSIDLCTTSASTTPGAIVSFQRSLSLQPNGSAIFIGDVIGVTASLGDSSKKFATTEFVTKGTVNLSSSFSRNNPQIGNINVSGAVYMNTLDLGYSALLAPIINFRRYNNTVSMQLITQGDIPNYDTLSLTIIPEDGSPSSQAMLIIGKNKTYDGQVVFGNGNGNNDRYIVSGKTMPDGTRTNAFATTEFVMRAIAALGK